jgi:hypothetical protein
MGAWTAGTMPLFPLRGFVAWTLWVNIE